jgi:hypothetical protein
MRQAVRANRRLDGFGEAKVMETQMNTNEHK